MIDSCDRLEDWNNGHKARSVSISIDNGYGASCWDVALTGLLAVLGLVNALT